MSSFETLDSPRRSSSALGHAERDIIGLHHRPSPLGIRVTIGQYYNMWQGEVVPPMTVILAKRPPLPLGIGSHIELLDLAGRPRTYAKEDRAIKGTISLVRTVELHWVEFVIKTESPSEPQHLLFVPLQYAQLPPFEAFLRWLFASHYHAITLINHNL